jgi:hypothetical protein
MGTENCDDVNLVDICNDDEVDGANIGTNEVDLFVSHFETADAPSFISTPIIDLNLANAELPVHNLNTSIAENENVVEEEQEHFPLLNT